MVSKTAEGPKAEAPSTAKPTANATNPGTTAPAPTIGSKPPAAAPGSNPAAPTVEVKAPPPLPPSPYEKLEAAFEAVKKQPPETAEFGPLMSEIQKAMDKLDDSQASATIRRRLDQRLAYLQLSLDIQAKRRKLAESQSMWSEHDKVIKQRMDEVAQTRQYTLVGRLSASSIYDGKRLPLMYRVQSVGGPAPRTMAYLRPDPKQGIDSKLGQVVGVLGESVMDPTLHINIITPLRVDTLEAAEPADKAPTSPPTEPAKPAADAGDNK
jgi:hypothetical protein